MSRRKTFYDMLIMAALMGGSSLTQESREDRILERETPEPAKPKGLKRFVINGKEVWAINYKNALRKSKKQH